jgi:adenylate cyclase
MWLQLRRRLRSRARRSGEHGSAPDESVSPANPQNAVQAGEARSIAVLPFINRSEAADEYFSDGISEQMLNRLAKLTVLKVAPKTSSFVFRDKVKKARTAARELGVDTVLYGSVRRMDQQVLVKARFRDAASGSRLWSKNYEFEMSGVFGVEDDIAQSITDALELRLSPKDRRTIRNVATSDARAYDCYLKGRSFMDSTTQRDYEQAIAMYHRALQNDPMYALAWAGIADAYAHIYRFADASKINANEALKASDKAVELDPDSSTAHASRGLACFINHDYRQAEMEFEKASELNPNIFEPYYYSGLAHTSQGHFNRAAKMYRKAMQANPVDYQPVIFLAQAYASLGHNREEMEARRASVDLLERHIAVNPHDTQALCRAANQLSAIGEPGRGELMAEEALTRGGNEPLVLYNIACFYARRGNKDRSLELLQLAIKRGWGDLAWFETDSDLDSLRDDARFKRLLERLS